MNDTTERDLRELRRLEKELAERTFRPLVFKSNDKKKTGNRKKIETNHGTFNSTFQTFTTQASVRIAAAPTDYSVSSS